MALGTFREMTTYLFVKFIHIVSSVVLVGTGFGSAFYMFCTLRSKDVAGQALVVPLVVRADWWFTTPAGVIQPLTGFALAWMAGFPLTASWLATSIGLYLVAGACWIPVVWLQLQMSAMAKEAVRKGTALPDRYWKFGRWWAALGYPAFAAMLVIFYLMVNKPSFGA